MDWTKPEVSIICNTYNHENYIEQAIDSFMMQKTSFPYEILINDDASTDKTSVIVQQYGKKYPYIVKPLIHKENQESQGKDSSLDFQFPRAKGEYMAFCEGDDYWTDPNKLQKQYDVMKAHPEVDICTHAVRKLNSKSNHYCGIIAPSNENSLFSIEEVIMGGGGFVGTNSIFCRSTINRDIPRFRIVFPYDYALQIHGSLRGGMYYLADTMSVYRVSTPNSWTSRVSSSERERRLHEESLEAMWTLLDEYTQHKFHDTIAERKKYRNFIHFYADRKYNEIVKKEYSEYYKKMSIWRRVEIRTLYMLQRIGNSILTNVNT